MGLLERLYRGTEPCVYMWVIRIWQSRQPNTLFSGPLGLGLWSWVWTLNRIPSPDPMERLDISCNENMSAPVSTELLMQATQPKQKGWGFCL